MSMIETRRSSLTNERPAARSIIGAGSHSECQQAEYGSAVHPAYPLSACKKSSLQEKNNERLELSNFPLTRGQSIRFDMSGMTRQAKPAVSCPLDGGVGRHRLSRFTGPKNPMILSILVPSAELKAMSMPSGSSFPLASTARHAKRAMPWCSST